MKKAINIFPGVEYFKAATPEPCVTARKFGFTELDEVKMHMGCVNPLDATLYYMMETLGRALLMYSGELSPELYSGRTTTRNGIEDSIVELEAQYRQFNELPECAKAHYREHKVLTDEEIVRLLNTLMEAAEILGKDLR